MPIPRATFFVWTIIHRVAILPEFHWTKHWKVVNRERGGDGQEVPAKFRFRCLALRDGELSVRIVSLDSSLALAEEWPGYWGRFTQVLLPTFLLQPVPTRLSFRRQLKCSQSFYRQPRYLGKNVQQSQRVFHCGT